LLVDLGPDRLGIHQTMIDTTIVAKEVDKGTGLAALRDWVLGADAETIAVGDDEPDLAMFRVATRSFAPANIGCARKARLLGCQIADSPHQRGLREIALAIVHSDGGQCERCLEGEAKWSAGQDLFLQLLRAADRNRATNLIAALCDPRAFGVFVR
jgi:hypothetical protein